MSAHSEPISTFNTFCVWSIGCKAKLLFDYNPTSVTELRGREGDVCVVEADDVGGWVLVRLGESVGYVPRSYLMCVANAEEEEKEEVFLFFLRFFFDFSLI